MAESDVGRSLADLVILPDGRHLLAVDPVAHELLMVEYRDRARVVDRLAVSPDPVRLVVSSDGRSCVMASRWSRRLTFVELGNKADTGQLTMAIAGRIDLPFCPRELAIIPGQTSGLVVADAFGGRLAVVDLERRTIQSLRSLPAHNIRGLAFKRDGQTLVITHQYLNRLAHDEF